jgi:ABC-type proline/glycine betaine transport system permease subunit
MLRLLHQYPTLMALNSFAGLKYVAEKAQKASQACGCNANQVYIEHARDFELALTNLVGGDHMIVKQVMGIDEICYHVKKASGQFELRCL